MGATHQVRKAVITAAGRGTRMYPASQTVQKELFPLVDVDGFAKPTLQIIVEEALASGIEEVCVVLNPANAAPIREHFHGLTAAQKSAQFAGKEWATALSDALDDMAGRLTFVVQEEQEGYGHAIFQARAWVGDAPCVVLLGDHVYRSFTDTRCTRQVMDAYQNDGIPVSSVVRTPEALIPRLGTVAGRPLGGDPPVYEVTAMAEKPSLEAARDRLRTPGLPAGEYLCFFGIHVFPPAVFDCLERMIRADARERGEYQLTTALEMLMSEGRYLVSEVHGERYDMGVPEGLVETQIALALCSPFRAHALALLKSHYSQ